MHSALLPARDSLHQRIHEQQRRKENDRRAADFNRMVRDRQLAYQCRTTEAMTMYVDLWTALAVLPWLVPLGLFAVMWVEMNDPEGR